MSIKVKCKLCGLDAKQKNEINCIYAVVKGPFSSEFCNLILKFNNQMIMRFFQFIITEIKTNYHLLAIIIYYFIN